MATDPKLTEASAAEELGLAASTLRRWRARPPHGGGPKYLKLGRAVRYRLSDLREFEAARQLDRTEPRRRAS